MSQSLRRLINLESQYLESQHLETQYNGPPPPRTLRTALFGGPAFAHRQRNAEAAFLNAEAIKAVQAIAKRRSQTQTPKANDRLSILADDLRRLRAKAILQRR